MESLEDLLRRCGEIIAKSKYPHPTSNVVERWDRLVEDWIRDDSLPLFIRRSLPRGTPIRHSSGRDLVPTDNTPAHWVFASAVRAEVPTVDIDLLKSIPIAMAIKKTEKVTATFTTSGRKGLLNDYKLCHIEAVKIGYGNIQELPIEDLQDHVRRFLKPSNMFMLPKKYGGLGEIDIVIDSVCAARV